MIPEEQTPDTAPSPPDDAGNVTPIGDGKSPKKPKKAKEPQEPQGNIVNEVKSYIQRIEELEELKADLAGQISSVKKEASHAGIPTDSINRILRGRKRMKSLGRDKYNQLERSLEYWIGELGNFYQSALNLEGGANGKKKNGE